MQVVCVGLKACELVVLRYWCTIQTSAFGTREPIPFSSCGTVVVPGASTTDCTATMLVLLVAVFSIISTGYIILCALVWVLIV